MTHVPPHRISARAAGEDAPGIDPAALDDALSADTDARADVAAIADVCALLRAAPVPDDGPLLVGVDRRAAAGGWPTYSGDSDRIRRPGPHRLHEERRPAPAGWHMWQIAAAAVVLVVVSVAVALWPRGEGDRMAGTNGETPGDANHPVNGVNDDNRDGNDDSPRRTVPDPSHWSDLQAVVERIVRSATPPATGPIDDLVNVTRETTRPHTSSTNNARTNNGPTNNTTSPTRGGPTNHDTVRVIPRGGPRINSPPPAHRVAPHAALMPDLRAAARAGLAPLIPARLPRDMALTRVWQMAPEADAATAAIVLVYTRSDGASLVIVQATDPSAPAAIPLADGWDQVRTTHGPLFIAVLSPSLTPAALQAIANSLEPLPAGD